MSQNEEDVLKRGWARPKSYKEIERNSPIEAERGHRANVGIEQKSITEEHDAERVIWQDRMGVFVNGYSSRPKNAKGSGQSRTSADKHVERTVLAERRNPPRMG